MKNIEIFNEELWYVTDRFNDNYRPFLTYGKFNREDLGRPRKPQRTMSLSIF